MNTQSPARDSAESLESLPQQDDFVRVEGAHLLIGSRKYHFLGVNFWAAANLGADDHTGDRARLCRELDRLASLGVHNLRIMAGSEGPDTEPLRIVPALQTGLGQYNESVLRGLDFTLEEMRRRNMRAVLCLSNFWHWTGGLAQYLNWTGAGPIPYPPPQEGGDWELYRRYVQRFYTYPAAITAYHTHIKTMVNRRNSISDRYYRDDPTIMAWELANEPEESEDRPAFVRWIAESAALIKDLDPKHLVISGSEGPSFEEVNRLKQIDYATIHIWPQNAGWYDPLQHQKTYAEALNRALQNIEQHIKITASLNKPLVLAEFGLARDLNNFDPRSSTEARDHFFATVFERIYASARLGQSLAGSNFWAWAGEGRRQSWGKYWRPGDQLIGDPPHEQQGWYSVFDSDASSLALIKEYAGKMDLE